MQQPSLAIEQPQFTDLATFAQRLTQAYISWHAPGTGEDVFSYFARHPRYTGDEHNLRATLIRERIVPVFHYVPEQIEYESKERFDLVLHNLNQRDRRRIAIIETKSSSVRNLAALRRGRETPVEQLERYLSQAGLYLGVLTNGDEWHLFDFAVGREPLASFSLLQLATLLQGASTKDSIEQRLASQPLLKQALTVTFYHLDARRWEQTDIFRVHLANNASYHIAALRTSGHVETLVQQIKQVLGSLRETIYAQFALLQQSYTEYQQRCTYTSATDKHPFEEALRAAIEHVGQFGTAFRLIDSDQLRQEIITLLTTLTEQYFLDGDITLFEGDYLQKARELLTNYQLSQQSLLEKKAARSVRILPPTEGLHIVIDLLQTHYTYLRSLDDVFLPPSAGATRPPEFTEDGVLGDDVDRYYLRRTRYVAYEKYRSQMRRRRNVALFRTAEKLLLGETSGGYYDRAGLFANHSVQVVVSWKALEASGTIEEKGIKTVLRESRQIADINDSLASIAELFDLRYLLGVINSRFIRQFIAANRLEGTREGRIYPDVWKRLPIKVASTERQQQIAALVDKIQEQYRQLTSLPTPATLAANPAILYRDIQAYLLRQDLRYVGDVQSAIAEKPTIREGRLILRRQPFTYLEAPNAPELLRYVELYLTQLHPELQGRSWAEVRQRIQAPSTLAAVGTFMASVDALYSQEEQMHMTIDTTSSRIEALVEEAYNEPADADKMKIINRKRSIINGEGLF